LKDQFFKSYPELKDGYTSVEIADKNMDFGTCQENDHKNRKIEFYCETDNLPLCAHCKIIGDHAAAESAGHNIIKIEDAY
jgi:hypothetical protein